MRPNSKHVSSLGGNGTPSAAMVAQQNQNIYGTNKNSNSINPASVGST